MRYPAVHYLDTDATIACTGLALEHAARERDDDPPKVTIHSCWVTCPRCRAWLERGPAAPN